MGVKIFLERGFLNLILKAKNIDCNYRICINKYMRPLLNCTDSALKCSKLRDPIIFKIASP